MASKDRERRLAREHYERQQQRRAEEQVKRRRTQQITAVVLALALVIGGVVGIALLTGGDEGVEAIPEASAEPSLDPGASPEPSAPVENVVEGCTDAPTGQPAAPSFAAPSGEVGRTATITTSCGVIAVELLADAAPQTVTSFSFLAGEGYFNDTPCHRLTGGGLFVLQCGDPTGTGTGGPGYTIPLENAPADGNYPAGTVAMARSSEPDSGGSQFFIVYADSPLPAPGYSIFGRVTSGLDIVERVAAAGTDGTTPASDGAPTQPIGILDVTIGPAAS